MKRGPKHAAKPAHVAPTIPEHIAALEIVKSVRPDGSYVCIHDLELTECDECAPIALLADEEAGGPAALDAEREERPASEDHTPQVARPDDDAAADGPVVQARLVEDSPTRTEYQIHAEFPAPEVRPVLVPDAIFDESIPENLSVACAALGLAGEHVLTHAIRGDGSVSIVTRGGSRLAWPCSEEQRHAALALTDQQRDGSIRDDEGNILPRGMWRTTPHTF